MIQKMLATFEAARRVSAPYVVIRTADQWATIQAIRETAVPDGGTYDNEYPIVQWDAARGITPANDLGEAALAKAKIVADDTIGFGDAMVAAERLPSKAILFVHNAQRQLASTEPRETAINVQALANLRDQFKGDFRMAVLLGPDVVMPPELEHDVVATEHELPGPDALGALPTLLVESANNHIADAARRLPVPDAATVARIVDATSGLSLFEAEQAQSMCLTEAGFDLPAMWERKRVAIEQTRGLSVYRGAETFADIVGLDAVKANLRRRLTARTPIGCVVVIDEGADVFANSEHDTSGVKGDQQRLLLTEMEDNGWPGIIATGVPGAGKSQIGKAFGNEAGVPTIMVDFGDMEAPHIGESEAFSRAAIRRIKAVGRGHAFFILTCNTLAGIRPQFQRRFRKGVYYFDVLTPEQRAAMWAHYIRKYELPPQPLPDDDSWMGAEIRECCHEAWDTNVSLVEAARQILPVARSRAAEIEEMRKSAHGRFLDANHFGHYEYRPEKMQRQMRAIQLPVAAAVVGDPRTLMPGAKES